MRYTRRAYDIYIFLFTRNTHTHTQDLFAFLHILGYGALV